MIQDRRSSKRGLHLAVSLLAALSVILSARVVAAAPLQDAATVPAAPLAGATPTRIEGQIKSIVGNTWQVDQTRVERTPDTTIIQARGAAQVGAWVLVVGEQYGDYLAAQTIQVLRPSGAAAPPYQFSGLLTKKGTAAWQINDTKISVTAATRVIGAPVVDNLVRVTARQVGNSLEATEIAVIAPDAGRVPYAIEGVVDQVTDTAWVVEDRTILVPPEQNVMADPGDTVEVAAVTAADGSLVAQQAQVVDVSQETLVDGYVTSVSGLGEDDQTWTVLAFDGGHMQTKTVQVTAETYVDEDRAVIDADVEARVQGQKRGEASVDAALVRLEQPVTATASGALASSSPDGLWRVGDQLVWFGSEQLRQEALASAAASTAAQARTAGLAPTPDVVVRGVRLRNGMLMAKEVLTGAAAAEARLASNAGQTGAVAAAMGSSGWFGPNGIAPGMIKAAEPTLLFDSAGGGHAVFESDGKIYYAYQQPRGGWGAPVKIGTGVAPCAAFDAHGQLHVAYANEFLNNFDILHVSMAPGGSWSLPKVVAPTSGKSADPVIAADATGHVYVAWADLTSGEWAIQLGAWDGRYWTSYPVLYARGQSAALDLLSDGNLFLTWQDRIPLPGNNWGKYDVFASEFQGGSWTLPRNVSDNATFRPGSDSIGPQLATTQDGLAHLAWIDDGVQVRYDLGRGSYWPEPVDVSDGRTAARGLSIQAASDGLLYLAWDDGSRVLVSAAPPGAQVWPGAQAVASATPSTTDSVSDVSLTAANSGVAISWVEGNTTGGDGIYESRHHMAAPMSKSYLPLIMQ